MKRYGRKRKPILPPPAVLLMNNGEVLLERQLKQDQGSYLTPVEYEEVQQFRSFLPTVNAEIQSIAEKPFSFLVKVLLDEHQKDVDHKGWILTNKDGFIMYSPNNASEKIVYKAHSLSLMIKNHELYSNGKRCRYADIIIAPRNGHLNFENKNYQGSFRIVLFKDHWYLINQLDIEDYSYAVLGAESWPGWPLEVNKAFAIATRSYLIAKVLESRTRQTPFHIKNTNIHQTYNGVHEHDKLRQAIDETRGFILTHNKKVVEAMFDCCCGDIIPANISSVDFKKAPYLARNYPCKFCKTCKIYTWRLEYSINDFLTLLHDAGYMLKNIKSIKLLRDKAGIVQKIMIKDSRTMVTITGKQLYSLCSKIKSFCYSIELKGKKVCFAGRGYGHHLGICQWGARRMIDSGWSFESILGFYYPGTQIMQLKTIA